MKSNHLLIIYSFFVCVVLMLVGIFSAKNSNQIVSSLVYLPLIFYFGTRLFHIFKKSPKKRSLTPRVIANKNISPVTLVTEEETLKGIADNDKRLFLKLIGSAGFSMLLMALFTKKAQAAFFGSVPGPGTVSIKDSAGNKIDPAEKNPTDGYEITEIDDSGSPAYYGFVKKTGAWYIMQEDSTGAYRYAKGDSGFSLAWTGRTLLTYGYFNTVFG